MNRNGSVFAPLMGTLYPFDYHGINLDGTPLDRQEGQKERGAGLAPLRFI
jgi:hypothetical protein